MDIETTSIEISAAGKEDQSKMDTTSSTVTAPEMSNNNNIVNKVNTENVRSSIPSDVVTTTAEKSTTTSTSSIYSALEDAGLAEPATAAPTYRPDLYY